MTLGSTVQKCKEDAPVRQEEKRKAKVEVYGYGEGGHKGG